MGKNKLPSENDYKSLVKLGEGLEIWHVHIDSIKEQDVNARYMDKREFDILTKNIGDSKRLESLPFCYWNKEKERIEIISGHHRVRAARSANMTHIHILIDLKKLTKSQIISKQLSHNSLSGKDDAQTLKELFDKIEDMEEQFKSGIDPEEINAYTTLENAQIENINFKYAYKVMQMIFLPNDLEKVLKTFDFIAQDFNLIADTKTFGPFIKKMREVSKEANIRNVSAILTKVCEIVDEYYKIKERKTTKEEKNKSKK